MNYHSETFPEGAVLRIYRDEKDDTIWRIQVTGSHGANDLVDIRVFNGLELELGTMVKE